MSKQDSLDDIVGKARGEAEALGSQNDSASGQKKPETSKNANLIVLVIIALVLLLVRVVVIDAESRQLDEDAALAALQIFTEADSRIVDYFRQNRELPEEYPDNLYRSAVEYQKTDDDRYTIRVLIEPHDTVVERNTDRNTPPENLEDLLNI